MYWDLNVAYPSNRKEARAIAVMAIQLGYDGIVWCRIVSSKLTPKEMNTIEYVDVSDVWNVDGSQQSVLRLKQPDYQLPQSSASSSSAANTTAVASSSTVAPAHGFQQRSRVHIQIEDASQLHSLNPANAVLQSYDLISVSTTNEKLFHACCSHESVDIVVVESSRKLPFYLKKPAINVALERGIHFEFQFAPSLKDSSARRYLFSNLLAFLRLTKGRHIALASGATKEMELRAPWDCINLGVLAGLDAATSKASISAHARTVLLHAEARKTLKCVLKEVKAEETTNTKIPSGSSSSSSLNAARTKPQLSEADSQQLKKQKVSK